MPMSVATKRNSRVGRDSASTLACLGYLARERPLLGFRIPPEPLCRCTHPACRGRRSGKPHRGEGLPLVVPKGGLEPPRPKPLPPQGSASTTSATWATSRCAPLRTRHTGTVRVSIAPRHRLRRFGAQDRG